MQKQVVKLLTSNNIDGERLLDVQIPPLVWRMAFATLAARSVSPFQVLAQASATTLSTSLVWWRTRCTFDALLVVAIELWIDGGVLLARSMRYAFGGLVSP